MMMNSTMGLVRDPKSVCVYVVDIFLYLVRSRVKSWFLCLLSYSSRRSPTSRPLSRNEKPHLSTASSQMRRSARVRLDSQSTSTTEILWVRRHIFSLAWSFDFRCWHLQSVDTALWRSCTKALTGLGVFCYNVNEVQVFLSSVRLHLFWCSTSKIFNCRHTAKSSKMSTLETVLLLSRI